MSNMRVRLLLDLVNGIKAPAREARRDLKGVADEARKLDRTKAAEKLRRDMVGVANVSRTTATHVRSVSQAADGIGRSRGIDAMRAGLRQAEEQARRTAIAVGGIRMRDQRGRFVGAGGAGAGGAGMAGAQGAAPGGGMAAVAGNIQMLSAFAMAYGGYRTAQTVGKELSFDKLMFELEKATDETGSDLKKRETSIRRMALQTGKTKEDLARIMIDAAFANRPKDDLARFTEFAAAAVNAWGTSAQETGQALAELGNIYKASQKRLEEIGDAVNTAADISASKEPDLLQFLRTAGEQARGVGMSAEQTLAFAAAMKERGIRTDVASTGFKALLTKVTTFDEDDEGFAGALSAAGVNAKKFKQAIAKDATGAVLQLLKGLDKINDPLKRMEAFKGLGGLEYVDDFSSLAGAVDRVEELAEKLGNRANYVGSTMRQAAQAGTKEFNKVERSMRALEEAGSTLAKALIIPLGAVAEKFNEIAKAAFDARDATQAMKQSFDSSVETLARKQAEGTPFTEEERRRVLNDPALRAAVTRSANARRSQSDFEATQQRMEGAETPEAALRERGRLLGRQLERQIETLVAKMAADPRGGSMGDRKRLEALRRQRADLPSNALEGDLPFRPTRSASSSEGGRAARESVEALENLRSELARITRLAREMANIGPSENRAGYGADAREAERKLRETYRLSTVPGSGFGLGSANDKPRPGKTLKPGQWDTSPGAWTDRSGISRIPAGQQSAAPGPGSLGFGLGGIQRFKSAFDIDLGEAGVTMMERFSSGLRTGQANAEGAADGVATGVRSRLSGIDASTEGRQVASSFAAGLRSGEAEVAAAAQALAGKARVALATSGSQVRSRINGALNDGVA